MDSCCQQEPLTLRRRLKWLWWDLLRFKIRVAERSCLFIAQRLIPYRLAEWVIVDATAMFMHNHGERPLSEVRAEDLMMALEMKRLGR